MSNPVFWVNKKNTCINLLSAELVQRVVMIKVKIQCISLSALKFSEWTHPQIGKYWVHCPWCYWVFFENIGYTVPGVIGFSLKILGTLSLVLLGFLWKYWVHCPWCYWVFFEKYWVHCPWCYWVFFSRKQVLIFHANLYKMSNPVFWVNKKNTCINLLSAELVQRVVMIKVKIQCISLSALKFSEWTHPQIGKYWVHCPWCYWVFFENIGYTVPGVIGFSLKILGTLSLVLLGFLWKYWVHCPWCYWVWKSNNTRDSVPNIFKLDIFYKIWLLGTKQIKQCKKKKKCPARKLLNKKNVQQKYPIKACTHIASQQKIGQTINTKQKIWINSLNSENLDSFVDKECNWVETK